MLSADCRVFKELNRSHPGAQLILAELLERINDENCHSPIGLHTRSSAMPVQTLPQPAGDIFYLLQTRILVPKFVPISPHFALNPPSICMQTTPFCVEQMRLWGSSCDSGCRY
jgi:hypothetical protein